MIPLYMCIYWYCQKKQWKDSKKVIKKSYLNRIGRGRNRSKSRCTTYVLHHFWCFNYMNSLPNFENKFNLKGNWSSKEKKVNWLQIPAKSSLVHTKPLQLIQSLLLHNFHISHHPAPSSLDHLQIFQCPFENKTQNFR